MKFLTFTLLLTSLTGFAAAEDNVVIKNMCPYKVYIHMASDQYILGDPTSKMLGGLLATLDQGQVWTDPYRYPAVGGISIKLAKSTPIYSEVTPHTQFEYKIWNDNGNRQMSQDLSNVDCGGNNPGKPTGPCPFQDYGMIFEQPGCLTRECRPGDVHCHDSYNLPDHNHACSGCFIDRFPGDSTLELCNYNVANVNLRRSRIWQLDMDSSENIKYIKTQPTNTTQLR